MLGVEIDRRFVTEQQFDAMLNVLLLSNVRRRQNGSAVGQCHALMSYWHFLYSGLTSQVRDKARLPKSIGECRTVLSRFVDSKPITG